MAATLHAFARTRMTPSAEPYSAEPYSAAGEHERAVAMSAAFTPAIAGD